MRAVGYWLLGMGFLHLGHALVRLVVGLLPANERSLDPPMWAIALLVASAGAHVLVGKRVLEGRPAARFWATALVAAWIAATLLALNTESLDPPHDGVRFGHGLAALGGISLGVRWPTMPTHAALWMFAPTGLWGVPELLAAAFTVGLGLSMIGFLWTAPLPSGDGAAPGETDLRRKIAAIRSDASRPLSQRLLGAAVSLHLALNAVLVVASLIQLSFRVAGRTF